MTKLLIILIVGLFCEAVGVVYLKKGLTEIGTVKKISVSEVLRVIKTGAANQRIWLGLAFETAFFVALLIMMSKGSVSFVWPLTSLSFVFTTFAAKIYLHEPVSPLRWSGVMLIMLGAGLISYSEKLLEQKPMAAPVTQSESAQ
ncbi:MAG TPA: EamA family transporter [Verrucomicrobiae bacterium]|jgi:uncharacterized membrane protein|nr:EamA family transporter [Verrucomicrobiae bacterium]